MTLREFIYARLRDEVKLAEENLATAQAMGYPDGLHAYPGAQLLRNAALDHERVTMWLLDRRLWGAPRIARVQTMKALAYRWRAHTDYLATEWSLE